ncbi:hypothetical protein JQ506_16550 [Shinella sp. PSBB067]|uniref:hypothetical protein n=1 Tax=Shinella sp. PSBB067 TaxID=2715959 RepID=UPI00193B9688|nr:hypothetical protein [Shinella sp. PSBB067]QRI62457.1 hypothetical protein JQ506_16550 [Shinella sp. PSBB067]
MFIPFWPLNGLSRPGTGGPKKTFASSARIYMNIHVIVAQKQECEGPAPDKRQGREPAGKPDGEALSYPKQLIIKIKIKNFDPDALTEGNITVIFT